MSQITKDQIFDLINKVTEPHQKLIKAERKKLAESVYGIAMKKIPAAVADLYKKHPEYIQSTRDIMLRGTGLQMASVTTELYVPNSSTNYCVTVLCSDTQASAISKHINKIEKMDDDLNKLRSEIRAAITSLRTHKRVREQFPEVGKFLPPEGKFEVVVNLADIRKKL